MADTMTPTPNRREFLWQDGGGLGGVALFTNWLAGGGIKGGVTHGESDQWGYKPADPANPTYCYDVHATLLHLLGVDHERLTFRHNGIDRRLTDVHGSVIHEIIA